MFIGLIFERLTGKGRPFFKEILALLDLSRTKSFYGKSGSVLLFPLVHFAIENSILQIEVSRQNSNVKIWCKQRKFENSRQI